MAVDSTRDLHRTLALFIKQMEKSYRMTIPREEKDFVIKYMAAMIQAAGGLDVSDPQAVNKVKQGIITCLTTSKTAPQLNKQPIEDVLILMFKKDKDLTNIERLKLGVGLAYIKALEQNPDLDLNMPLLFKFFEKPESLNDKEREELSDDLKLVHDTIDSIPEIDDLPDLKKLSEQVKDLKEKIKDPSIPKDKDFVTQQADNLKNLWNGNPLFPQPGNLLAIPNGRPAISLYSPMDSLSGTRDKDIQGATLGTQVYERDETLGEDIHQNIFSNTDYETMKKLGFLGKEGFKETFKEELTRPQFEEARKLEVVTQLQNNQGNEKTEKAAKVEQPSINKSNENSAADGGAIDTAIEIEKQESASWRPNPFNINKGPGGHG